MASTEYTAKELGVLKLKVEKGVPMPEKYPHGAFAKLVEKMEIGDSILCVDQKQITGVQTALTKMGRGYATRKDPKGRRIWRTR